MVGLIDEGSDVTTQFFKNAGDVIILSANSATNSARPIS